MTGFRSIFDGRYGYTRYFALRQHNRPEAFADIVQYNDLELYDLSSHPEEMNNLARDPATHRELIEEQNSRMNSLIELEIGEDVGQTLPGAAEASWAGVRLDP